MTPSIAIGAANDKNAIEADCTARRLSGAIMLATAKA
jgi:hypothetical protein